MNLLKIEDATYTVELPDNTKKTYDLYELAEGIQAAERAAEGDWLLRADGIRKAFGFPTRDEAGTGPDAKFTLSRRQAFTLQADVLAKLQELPEAKKLESLARN